MRKDRRRESYREKARSKIFFRLISCIAAFSLGSLVAVSHSKVKKKGNKIHQGSCSSTPSSPMAEVDDVLIYQCATCTL